MTWLRKRGLPCLLIFALLFSVLTVPALAWSSSDETVYQSYVSQYFWLAPEGSILNNDTGVVGPLKFSNIPDKYLDSVLKFVRDFDEDVNNGNTHYHVFVSGDKLYVRRFSFTASRIRIRRDTDINNKVSGCIPLFTNATYCDYLVFDINTGECTSSDVVTSMRILADQSPGGSCYVSTLLLSLGFTRRDMWHRSNNWKHWQPFLNEQPVSFAIDYSRFALPTHTLSIDYLYEDGTEAAPSHVALLEEGSAYDVPSPELAGYTPDQVSISGEMGTEDAVFIVTYTKDPVPIETHTLSIYYVFSDGSQAADPYIGSVAEGAEYSIPSPVVSGYQTDRFVVSGVMGTEDEAVMVIYTPLAAIYKHTLTIQYQYLDGREAAPTYSASLAEGESYSVPSPAVKGYLPDRSMVSGSMGTDDVSFTVIYTSGGDSGPPAVEISYRFEDGSEAAPACRKELSWGQFYWITSPSVPGYTPDRRVLFGTAPRSGIAYQVTYYPSGSWDTGGSSGGIPWLPPTVSGIPYQPSGAGGLPWKP